MGVASLVLGIVAMVFCWVPYFGIILAIGGIAFGIAGLSVHRQTGMSIAGLCLSGTAALINLIVMLAVL